MNVYRYFGFTEPQTNALRTLLAVTLNDPARVMTTPEMLALRGALTALNKTTPEVARTEMCELSPEGHTDTCFCLRPARRHISYGSGCGNVCGRHANGARRRKGVLYVEGPLVIIPAKEGAR